MYTLSPGVDRYSSAEPEIGDEPDGIGTPAYHDRIDAFRVVERFYHGLGRQLAPGCIGFQSLEGDVIQSGRNYAVTPELLNRYLDVIRQPFTEAFLGGESLFIV